MFDSLKLSDLSAPERCRVRKLVGSGSESAMVTVREIIANATKRNGNGNGHHHCKESKTAATRRVMSHSARF